MEAKEIMDGVHDDGLEASGRNYVRVRLHPPHSSNAFATIDSQTDGDV